LDSDGRVWVLDLVRGQWDSYEREKVIKETARADGPTVLIGLEQSGGEGGKQSAEWTVRNLKGYRCRVWKVSATDGDKEFRAGPFSSQVNGGNVWVPEFAGWLKDFIDEVMHFPYSRYKDITDACSGAHHFLCGPRRRIGALGR
jgi:predicted phage terminase large subunit-like protein